MTAISFAKKYIADCWRWYAGQDIFRSSGGFVLPGQKMMNDDEIAAKISAGSENLAQPIEMNLKKETRD